MNWPLRLITSSSQRPQRADRAAQQPLRPSASRKAASMNPSIRIVRLACIAALAIAAARRAGAEHRHRQRQAGAEGARRHAGRSRPPRGGQQQPPELESAHATRSCCARSSCRKPRSAASPASADYKAQMELARQTILIRELFDRLPEEEPGHRRRSQGRVRQVQGPGHAAPSTARATSWSRRKTRPRS